MLAVSCLLLCAAPGEALAAGFPAKPVTILVPYPAGGAADAMVRPIAEKLSRLWGQPVLVDNRTGVREGPHNLRGSRRVATGRVQGAVLG